MPLSCDSLDTEESEAHALPILRVRVIMTIVIPLAGATDVALCIIVVVLT
jgi:hypothetical protein